MKNSKKHWFFSSSSRSRSRSSSSPAPATDEAPPPPLPTVKPGRPSPETYPGCMAMMHYIMFSPGAGCVGRPPSSSHAAAVAVVATNAASPLSPAGGGIQAPRNSLDLETEQQLRRDIQIGVQIEPAFDTLMARSSRRPSAAPSEAETPRTPSLVARLMGIDGLPESSPSPAWEKKKRVIPESISLRQRQPLISRSLPDTPRASTSSARPTAAPTWDVVDHPRLSLQVLKDNVLDRAAQYMSMPTSPTSGGGGKKKKSSRRRDAAEIVRQAKETVTNRKSKKNSAAIIGKENASPVHHQYQSGKENAPPATRAPLADVQQPHAPRLPLQPRTTPPPPQRRAKPSRPPPPPPPLDPPPPRATAPAVKCKRPDGCERFATRIKKQPSSPAASSTEYKDIAVVSGDRNNVAATGPSEEDSPEYVYLRRVLERGGFMRGGGTRRAWKGHSVATPVDPLVFHLLELEMPPEEEAKQLGPLRHRWNRKLLFHLTQEMLAEQLLGLDPTTSSSSSSPEAEALVARLWRRARSFPAADCKVVEDVLALVASDVEAAAASRRVVERRLLAEEADDVKDDVAEHLLDALLHELCSAVRAG
uniref:DUF4378 domain-containing protein n=1 Tax=Leersia perrieri TaxID=77586 RepID=A0A0D9W1T0_9ORYZ